MLRLLITIFLTLPSAHIISLSGKEWFVIDPVHVHIEFNTRELVQNMYNCVCQSCVSSVPKFKNVLVYVFMTRF